MTNIIIIICPGQVLTEKNWTDKVTAEMKNFEKSIIKAMRVCAITTSSNIYNTFMTNTRWMVGMDMKTKANRNGPS